MCVRTAHTAAAHPKHCMRRGTSAHRRTLAGVATRAAPAHQLVRAAPLAMPSTRCEARMMRRVWLRAQCVWRGAGMACALRATRRARPPSRCGRVPGPRNRPHASPATPERRRGQMGGGSEAAHPTPPRRQPPPGHGARTDSDQACCRAHSTHTLDTHACRTQTSRTGCVGAPHPIASRCCCRFKVHFGDL